MAIGVRPETPAEETRLIGVLNLLYFFMCGFSISIILLNLLGGHLGYTLMMAGALLLVMASWLGLARGVNYRIIGMISLISMDALALSMVVTGGVENSSFVWIFLLPLISLFVFGLRTGLISLTALFFCLILILFFPDGALLMTEYPSAIKIRIVLALLSVTLITSIAEYSRNRAHRQLLSVMEEEQRAETHRADLENQLRQSQKMEAVGQLAGGIAHDFNNLLTGIISHTDFAWAALPKTSEVRADIEVVRATAERASRLTSQLLAFSRKQLIKPEILDLNHVIERMEKIIRSTLTENVRMDIRVTDGLGMIKADRGQVEQVLMNLVLNARDALQTQGGTIRIGTANAEISDPRITAQWDAVPGEYVSLSTQDTGDGIHPSAIDHIFEPFFTTKEKGRGTGLGLSTVFGIVKQHLGFIEVTSEPGMGTLMRVFWPRVYERPKPLTIPPERPSNPPIPHTVLIVEDEEIVRRSARRILTGAGYRVLEAASGEEALEIVMAGKDPIHLLLTDVVMTGMTGVELAGHIAEQMPQIPVVLMSGYTEDAIDAKQMLDGSCRFLPKPFTSTSLLSNVKQALTPGLRSPDTP